MTTSLAVEDLDAVTLGLTTSWNSGPSKVGLV
jgi:hypothetical protein